MNRADQIPSRSPWVVVPPPPLFALVIAGGIWLNHAAPLSIAPRTWAGIAASAGWLIVAAAGSLMVSAAILFALRRTTIIPHRRASNLIGSGPYRLTRNPMYVGLTGICVGAALIVNVAWPILLLPVPLWVLHTKTIPFEERTLEGAFGDEYRDYCRRVRRWL